ncbi:DNA primase small subunit [Pyrgilauda ruficollis]|uniref:DNA primase small subunit n=1 Tax=Pyrgilauda ruficollis TaxID=221976 RepID=UPI001B8648D5|nr:DNA primase small subunit [Pyrgilauda ruficollis]
MAQFEPAALPELLPVFYRRLFPHGPYGRWLSYGGAKNYFQLREFSFTLRDDVYLRFQSFSSPQELERELQKINPYKIDIGAVYSHRPNQHNTVHLGAFQPQEKELVFDIDMTDYDDVRTCCSSADICSKCWTLMTIAVRIIDRALVGEGLGDTRGPRLGVWRPHSGAQTPKEFTVWKRALRSLSLTHLSLVKGGADTVKKVNLSHPVHPFIRRSVAVVQKYFEEHALRGQDILGSPERWDKVLALLPEGILPAWGAPNSLKHVPLCPSPSPPPLNPPCVPGRISVPLDLQKLEQFDPFSVPTITYVSWELGGSWCCQSPPAHVGVLGSQQPLPTPPDYRRTSLAPYVRLLEQFVEGMESARRGERIRRSDLQGDF